MRIATILGTTRPGNYTGKALALVNDQLRRQGVQLDAIDPAPLELHFPGHDAGGPVQEQLKAIVTAADGVIFATPEYHGGFSAMTKLLIENLGFPSVLAGKPVALLGVAAGRIGAIKSLEQLRSVCSHVGAVVLPGPVSIAGVRSVFDASGACGDPQIEKRVRGLATNLTDYIGKSTCPEANLESTARQRPDA